MTERKPVLLIFELHHLGDVLMSFPFIRGASDKFEVWVVCLPESVRLYAQVLPETQIMAWRPVWLGGGWKDAWEAIGTWRKMGASTSVCVWADARVHGFMFWSGAAQRLGFPMNRQNYYAHERPWRNRQLFFGQVLQELGALFTGGKLLTQALERREYQQHHLQDWRQLAEALGIAFQTAVPWLPSDPTRVPEALVNFLRAPRSAGKRVWMIHSGGRLPTKQWPRERFREILDDHFRRQEIPCVVVGEGWAMEESDALTFYAPPLDLETFVAAVNEVDAFLGNDSFPAHLAAALGKRVVTIFGSGHPDWFAPWQNESGAIASRTCPHWPCVDRCQMPSYVCLDDVRVADVIKKLLVVG